MVHVFTKGISLKVNSIVRLEFELTYSYLTIQRVNPYEE